MPQKPLPNYTWDPEARRYRDKNGHLVRKAVILALILRAVGRSKKAFEKAAEAYLDGKITELQFQAIMQQGIISGHKAMAAIAAGGILRLVGALLEKTRSIIATQQAYMLRFAAQIATGQLSPAQIAARSAMYGDALYSTFANIQTATAEAGGARYAKRIAKLDDGTCVGCEDQNDLGWQPIDEVLPIGDAECLTNCRCEMQYSDEIPAEALQAIEERQREAEATIPSI
jgi:hypothetical protein